MESLKRSLHLSKGGIPIGIPQKEFGILQNKVVEGGLELHQPQENANFVNSCVGRLRKVGSEVSFFDISEMSASTWDSRCEGFTLDADSVEQILREYQEEICTRFVVKKKEKLYGSSEDGRLWLSGLTIARAFLSCYEIDDAKLFRIT